MSLSGSDYSALLVITHKCSLWSRRRALLAASLLHASETLNDVKNRCIPTLPRIAAAAPLPASLRKYSVSYHTSLQAATNRARRKKKRLQEHCRRGACPYIPHRPQWLHLEVKDGTSHSRVRREKTSTATLPVCLTCTSLVTPPSGD